MDKKGRKFFQFSSKTKNIANETSGALVTTLTIVKESLDGVPIPGFKATVGGVLEVIKAVKKTKDNEEDIAQLRTNVVRLKEIIIEPLKNVEITDALRARIDVLMRDLEDIRTEFNKMSEKGHIRKFLAVHDHATTIAGLSRMLERALDSFMLGGAIEVERRIESVEQGVSKVEMMIEKFVLTQGQQELLNRLPSVDARYDSAARTIAPGCLEDTRVALLNEIFDWINDRSTREKIYWLYGLAGTGKSTIAQTVAARLDQESRLGASFFFSRDSKELRDPLRVLPTIACQLAELSPEFKRHLAVSLEGRKDAGTSALPIQMEKLIFDPLRAIEFSTFTLLVIVIDALDECEGAELTSVLLELISQFVVDLPNVEMKVFMTSRPEHHVMDKFKKNAMGPVSRPFALHDIEHSVVQADIQVFLRHELARLAHEFNIHDPLSPWPSEEDINELTARAGTLFIVASTGIKFIADPHVRHPKRQLRALLSDAPMSGTSPYRNLDQVYLCVLEAAVGNSKDPSDYVCCRLREVLGAIIIVLDPLSATALSHLTGLETDDIRATVDLLHSVIIAPQDPFSVADPLRIMHLSFPNFLTERCSDPRFYINSTEYHYQMTVYCLRVLNTFLKRNICQLVNPLVPNSDISDLQEQLLKVVEPHHRYACQYWAQHLNATSKKCSDIHNDADPSRCSIDTWKGKLLEALSIFCTEKLLAWLEILSLLGYVKLAIVELKSAEKCLRLIDPTNPLCQLLYDGHRLVQSCLVPIQHSASQVYHSGLALMPHSLLYETYKSANDKSVKMLMGRPAGWDACISVM